MTILELMTNLTNADTIPQGAKLAAESNIAGAKDVYLAWGKERGVAAKLLESAWKEAQPVKASTGAAGFANVYYDWLAEDSRTEQEAADMILSNESKNVRNHLTHYLNIWALAESVRQGKRVHRTIVAGKAKSAGTNSANKAKAEPEPKDEWEFDDSHPFADVRSAKENLKREQRRAKPRKTRVHPDKVAKFKDEELTKAYTAAFQAYFG